MSGLAGLPVIGGLFDDSADKALDELKKNSGIYAGLQLPDYEQYSPELLQAIGNYSPEMMQAQTVSEDPRLRSYQMDALAKMAGLADTGLSAVDEAGYNNAKNIGLQQAKGSRDAILQNAQARGVAGGGLEMAMKEMADQSGANASQQAALQQSADSARQRALYEQAYGNQLNQTRAQDFSNNSANADIINRFNMANTQAKNQAQLTNLQNNQSIANQNVQNRNSAQQYNNGLTQQTFQDSLAKANGQAGANTGMAQGYEAQNAAEAAKRKAAGIAVGAGLGYGLGGKDGAGIGAALGGGLG